MPGELITVYLASQRFKCSWYYTNWYLFNTKRRKRRKAFRVCFCH